jgi:uncharacterized protein
LEASPFPHHGPLAPEQVSGRDGLLADLHERVVHHQVTSLVGPRRYGKTSVLRRLAWDLADTSTVAVDLSGVQTHADLVVKFATAMRTAVPEARDTANQLSVAAGIDLEALRADLQLPVRRRPDARLLYPELVKMLVDVGRGTRLCLVFDEFQSIVSVQGALAVLRTELQHHYRDIGLVFAGSAPAVMRDIFALPDQPFYSQADVIEMEPLDLSAVHGIVTGGFQGTGRDPGGIAGRIYTFAAGHPQRTMRAADEAWQQTPDGGNAENYWGASIISLREAEAATLAATFADLAGDERKVLRICATGGALFGAAAQRLGLSAGGAAHARQRLLAEGKLRAEDGGVVVTDPLLADWVRQRLPG